MSEDAEGKDLRWHPEQVLRLQAPLGTRIEAKDLLDGMSFVEYGPPARDYHAGFWHWFGHWAILFAMCQAMYWFGWWVGRH